MKRIDEMFVMERKTEDKLWYDYSTLANLRETTQNEANKTDNAIPQWSRHNPQTGIVKVYISEGHPYHPNCKD